MDEKTPNPYEELERIFHEPHRLAIMSSLLGSPEGLTFNELKEACGLTDGNLSRHLKALEEVKAVRIKKRFVRNRPQTTAYLSPQGCESFMQYLQALQAVLKDAAAKLATRKKEKAGMAVSLSLRPAGA